MEFRTVKCAMLMIKSGKKNGEKKIELELIMTLGEGKL